MKEPAWLRKQKKQEQEVCTSKVVRVEGGRCIFLKGCGATYSDWNESVRKRQHSKDCAVYSNWYKEWIKTMGSQLEVS